MAVWPASLPALSVNLTENRQDATIRTQMDMGPSKMRRRFSAVSRYVSGSITVDDTDRATFDTFFATTIEEGALTFDMNDPVDGGTETWRFTGPPSYTAQNTDGTNATLWTINLALEILP